MVLDMLQSEEARTAILSYYQDSDEPEAIRTAIEDACKHPGGLSELQTNQKLALSGTFNPATLGTCQSVLIRGVASFQGVDLYYTVDSQPPLGPVRVS